MQVLLLLLCVSGVRVVVLILTRRRGVRCCPTPNDPALVLQSGNPAVALDFCQI